MMLPSPQAILFDWDNTLVDTWPIIHSALHDTFVQMELQPWTLHQVKSLVRKSMRDSFPELFGSRWEEAGKMYQDFYRSTHLERLVALSGAEEMLKHIADTDTFIAVVSNKRGQHLRTEVAHLGWDKYFDALVGADDAEKDKPSPDPVLLALKDSGLEPGPDVWFIGDSEVDLETAHVTRCSPILFGEPLVDAHDPEKRTVSGFPYLVHTLDHPALLKLCKEMI